MRYFKIQHKDEINYTITEMNEDVADFFKEDICQSLPDSIIIEISKDEYDMLYAAIPPDVIEWNKKFIESLY